MNEIRTERELIAELKRRGQAEQPQPAPAVSYQVREVGGEKILTCGNCGFNLVEGKRKNCFPPTCPKCGRRFTSQN